MERESQEARHTGRTACSDGHDLACADCQCQVSGAEPPLTHAHVVTSRRDGGLRFTARERLTGSPPVDVDDHAAEPRVASPLLVVRYDDGRGLHPAHNNAGAIAQQPLLSSDEDRDFLRVYRSGVSVNAW